VSVGATLTASLLAVLDRPSTWLLALVGFLVRGGWLIVLAPIVVLPTAVGVANVVAPLLEDVAFGRRTEQVLAIAGAALLVAAAWLVGGGLLAAAAEAEVVRRVAEDALARGGRSPTGSRVAWRVLDVRLIASLPLGAALVWGALRLVAVGYRELTVPSDVSTPAAYRIAGGAPDAILAVIVAWLAAEIVGAIGARRVILGGTGVGAALRAAFAHLRADPRSVLVIAIVGSVVLVVVLSVAGLALGTVWDALGNALATGDASIGTSIVLVLFVGLFAGCLVLIALTAAWRAAIWTVEAPDGSRTNGGGTFGGGTETRSGD
jgi:hypothetical protein